MLECQQQLGLNISILKRLKIQLWHFYWYMPKIRWLACPWVRFSLFWPYSLGFWVWSRFFPHSIIEAPNGFFERKCIFSSRLAAANQIKLSSFCRDQHNYSGACNFFYRKWFINIEEEKKRGRKFGLILRNFPASLLAVAFYGCSLVSFFMAQFQEDWDKIDMIHNLLPSSFEAWQFCNFKREFANFPIQHLFNKRGISLQAHN